jgi:hypothetical protein
MYARHCDHRPECDSWQRIGAEQPVFITVAGPWQQEYHFCSLSCLMFWAAAHSAPTEVVSTESNEGN